MVEDSPTSRRKRNTPAVEAWSSDARSDPWLPGNSRAVTVSRAMKAPTACLPGFPESFTPHEGSAMVRVWTTWNGVAKMSALSMKNGRFSG